MTAYTKAALTNGPAQASPPADGGQGVIETPTFRIALGQDSCPINFSPSKIKRIPSATQASIHYDDHCGVISESGPERGWRNIK